MNAIKYIGMDVHLATISIAVLDAMGKFIMEVTIATEARALLDFIRGLSGTLYVALEEGTSAHWLYTLLEPHVANSHCRRHRSFRSCAGSRRPSVRGA